MTQRPLGGVEFFDGEETHAAYQARRESGRAPNELLELDAFDAMLGDVQGLDVLDLGCGDGRYGRELIGRGCASYLGIDASGRMLELARQALAGTSGEVRQAQLEEVSLPERALDVVVSRMTFHWILDLQPVFARICAALRPHGKLAFSVEHPVITCCASARPQGQQREHWLVDDYFVPGAREASWFGVTVRKYHRSVEQYVQLLRSSGLRIADLREATPSSERIPEPAELQRRRRIPLMLLLRADRTDGG